MNKTQYLSIIVVVLAIIGGAIFYRTAIVTAPGDDGTTSSPKASPTPTPTPTVFSGTVTIAGTIDCLPKIDTGKPQTEECAIGLRATNGKYYALTGIDTNDFVSGKISTGMSVTITGEASTVKNSIYNIVGSINVTKYK
jgi:hypothetical protein